jgi:23S rRNA pseudouridine1911/1915/1917 synthase
MEIKVSSGGAGSRLDLYLRENLSYSRSYLKRIIEEGRVSIDGEVVDRASHQLKGGERISIKIPRIEEIKGEPLPIDIVYEDKEILVVSKPPGMVTHPTHLIRSQTLLNALLAHCDLPYTGGELRRGIVHRLDKDTSGLLVVAKDNHAYIRLVEDLKERKIKRRYTALVYGEVMKDEGLIQTPLGRPKRGGTRMRIWGRRPKEARTHYRVIERFTTPYTLLELTLFTGRTHQIRVHLSSIGHPIVADPIYSKRGIDLPIKRQALHAHLLGLYHPGTGRYMEFHSPLPEDMEGVVRYLRG